MAKLYITEYATIARTAYGALPMPDEPAVASQVLEIGVTSTASEPFSGSTRFVCLHADDTCSLVFGTEPFATPDDQRLTADVDVFRGVAPGMQVAVILND